MNVAIIAGRELALSPLEAIRVLATRFGYDDVDVEPTGTGGFTVTASSGAKAPATVTASSLEKCCEKFCARLLT